MNRLINHWNQKQILYVILRQKIGNKSTSSSNFKFYKRLHGERSMDDTYAGLILDSIYPYIYKLPKINLNSKQSYAYYDSILSWLHSPELLHFTNIVCTLKDYEQTYQSLVSKYPYLLEYITYSDINKCDKSLIH